MSLGEVYNALFYSGYYEMTASFMSTCRSLYSLGNEPELIKYTRSSYDIPPIKKFDFMSHRIVQGHNDKEIIIEKNFFELVNKIEEKLLTTRYIRKHRRNIMIIFSKVTTIHPDGTFSFYAIDRLVKYLNEKPSGYIQRLIGPLIEGGRYKYLEQILDGLKLQHYNDSNISLKFFKSEVEVSGCSEIFKMWVGNGFDGQALNLKRVFFGCVSKGTMDDYEEILSILGRKGETDIEKMNAKLFNLLTTEKGIEKTINKNIIAYIRGIKGMDNRITKLIAHYGNFRFIYTQLVEAFRDSTIDWVKVSYLSMNKEIFATAFELGGRDIIKLLECGLCIDKDNFIRNIFNIRRILTDDEKVRLTYWLALKNYKLPFHRAFYLIGEDAAKLMAAVDKECATEDYNTILENCNSFFS
jgi:hypothetical protein